MTTPTPTPNPAALARVLRELETKATPGPWVGDRFDGTVKYWILGPNEQGVCRGGFDGRTEETYGFQNDEDAVLVMTLRNNLPALLAALEDAGRYRVLEKMALDAQEIGISQQDGSEFEPEPLWSIMKDDAVEIGSGASLDAAVDAAKERP